MRLRKSSFFPSKEILNGTTYFAITLGSDDGENWWSETQTHWTGFADDDRRIELRHISPVLAGKMADHWKERLQPFYVVNDNRGFVRWTLGGGHALVSEDQICKHLPGEMKPRKCVIEGSSGFKDLDQIPKAAFQNAPTPKVRMKVLKRDKYRCMICGQRPADDVNIQLHTHHIRPFSKSGVTTEKNLITLCHTCHTGLEPHYEWNLFDLIEKKFSDVDGQSERRSLQKYIINVKNYQRMVGKLLDSSDKTKD